MHLKEFSQKIKPEDVFISESTLSENILVSDLDYQVLSNMQDTVFTVDENGKAKGKIRKELLLYLCESNNTDIYFGLLNKLSDGVIAIDESGRIFYANEAYTTLLGVPRRRIIGKYIQNVEPESLLCKTLNEKKEHTSEKQLIPSLNHYVSLNTFPIWKGKQFRGAVSIFHDVTEILMLNKQVEQISILADEFDRKYQTLSTVHSMGIVTRDKEYLKLLSEAAVIAKTDAPILIRGENGVGKEVLANYIYKCSERKNKPMITVNCAAIPGELLESELFGYEDGAFTGAKKGGKKGQFELANGGTIFLDEIGDMPLAMQSKLLRVIQNGEIEKLGRQKKAAVDVRIIAATNQDLEKLISERTFRQDLFFRLNTFSITIPPLRDRPGDIPLLANHFLQYYNEKYHKSFKLGNQTYQKLLFREWHGNVRELQGYIERSVVLENDALMDSAPNRQSSGEYLDEKLPEGTLESILWNYEDSILRAAIAESGGNKTAAIERLGISRRTFFRKCSEHGIIGKQVN